MDQLGFNMACDGNAYEILEIEIRQGRGDALKTRDPVSSAVALII